MSTVVIRYSRSEYLVKAVLRVLPPLLQQLQSNLNFFETHYKPPTNRLFRSLPAVTFFAASGGFCCSMPELSVNPDIWPHVHVSFAPQMAQGSSYGRRRRVCSLKPHLLGRLLAILRTYSVCAFNHLSAFDTSLRERPAQLPP